LWLGSKGGKIFCYNNNKLKWTFPDDLSSPNRLKLEKINVYELFIDSADNLWIGTKSMGLFILKDIINTTPDNLEIVHLGVEINRGLDRVYSVIQDKFGDYWIGSHNNGITVLKNPFEIPEFANYNYNGSPDQLIGNRVRYLFFDRDNNLWIGTSSGISL